MKSNSFKISFSFLALILCLVACQNGHRESKITRSEDGRTVVTTIEITDKPVFKLTYSGTIKLNEAKTAFKSMSPHAYVKYKKGHKEMIAESDMEGYISYALSDGRQKLAMDETGKKFLAETIQDMLAKGFNAK